MPFESYGRNIIGDKLSGRSRKTFLKRICGKNFTNTEKAGVGKGVGCSILDTAINNEELLNEVINTILIFSIVISLLDGKCSVTESGKKMLPNSYTANITHWIHKIAGLIYIYGEIQNLVTLRTMDEDFAKKAEGLGQLEQFQAMLEVLKSKKDAAEDKLKILEIANLGFAASAAIDIGLSAGFSAWGGYKQLSEGRQCKAAIANNANCGNISMAAGTAEAALGAKVSNITEACVAKFSNLSLSNLLINEAKSQVMNTVTKGIGGIVGGAIGNFATKQAGGGTGAKIVGTGLGAYIGTQVAGKVSETISSSTDMLETDGDSVSSLIKGEPKACIQTGIEEVVEDTTKQLVLSAAVNACGATLGTTCSAIPANCAITTVLSHEDCTCFTRNSARISGTLTKIASNLNFLDDLGEDASVLETLATDNHADEKIVDLKKEILGDPGVPTKERDKVCGIDYSNWLIRHDLECKASFSWITDSDIEAQEVKTIDQTNSTSADEVEGDENAMIKHMDSLFKNEMKSMAYLLDLNLNRLGSELEKGNKEVVGQIFKEHNLISEYNGLTTSEQIEVDQVLGTLVKSLKIIKNNMFFANAYADETSNEFSILGGLGLGIVGIVLFPEVLQDMMNLNTVLHRNPLRRGLYFLTTYFLADVNIETTELKLKKIQERIGQVEALIREETTILYPIKNILDFDIIPKAFANRITDNRVPLCVSGTKFSTSCTCKEKGSCGNEITRFNESSLVFSEVPTYAKFAGLQMSFANKMTKGEITSEDYVSLKNSLKSYEKRLNPIIASDNLDMILAERGVEPLKLVARSKNLVASLRQSTVKKLENITNKNIDLSDIKLGARKEKNNEEQSKTVKTEQSKYSGTDSQKALSYSKASKQVEKANVDMSKYDLNRENIIQDENQNLFKIISNRYLNTWFNNKLNKN